MTKRYIAKFTAQAWQGDYAMDLWTESWDVTKFIENPPDVLVTYVRSVRETLEASGLWEADDAQEDTLFLDEETGCPARVLEHSGPFNVTVEAKEVAA